MPSVWDGVAFPKTEGSIFYPWYVSIFFLHFLTFLSPFNSLRLRCCPDPSHEMSPFCIGQVMAVDEILELLLFSYSAAEV